MKQAVSLVTDKVGFVNLQTQDGNTPLHYAAAAADTRVLRQLLRAGANMAIKNSYGQLPLHLAEVRLLCDPV